MQRPMGVSRPTVVGREALSRQKRWWPDGVVPAAALALRDTLTRPGGTFLAPAARIQLANTYVLTYALVMEVKA